MKRFPTLASSALAASTLFALGACTTSQPPASPAHASHYGSTTDQQGAHMQAMCERHRKMINASPEEKQAMMDSRMSPEAMEKHMQMMREKCK